MTCICGAPIVRSGSRGPIPKVCPPCRGEIIRARQRRIWLERRDQRAEARRRYRAEHPERARQVVNGSAARNRERIRASQARPEARAAQRARRRENRATNPLIVRERANRYQREHPEHHATAQRRRRARLRGATIETYRASEIFERDGWVCQLCRFPVDRFAARNTADGASIDHVIPIAAGGADAPHNVQLAHFRCNIAKGARLEVAA